MGMDTNGSTVTFYLPAVGSNVFATVEASNVFGLGVFSGQVESKIGKIQLLFLSCIQLFSMIIL